MKLRKRIKMQIQKLFRLGKRGCPGGADGKKCGSVWYYDTYQKTPRAKVWSRKVIKCVYGHKVKRMEFHNNVVEFLIAKSKRTAA
jgi:hypothetical protein